MKRILRNEDAQGLVQLLRGMTELERGDLLVECGDLLTESDGAANSKKDGFRTKGWRLLVRTGIAPVESLYNGALWAFPSDWIHCSMELISQRPQAWREAWRDRVARFDSFHLSLVLEAIALGLVSPPNRPKAEEQLARYYHLFVNYQHHRAGNFEHPLDYWCKHPWTAGWPTDLLFEREGNAADSLANADKWSLAGYRWSEAFPELIKRGFLVREWVIDRGLQALEQDFTANRAGWFQRLLRDLDLSMEEISAREDRYLGLLGSRVRTTVTFATDALSRLHKAGRINAGSFFAAASPCLLDRTKKVPLTALRMVKGMVQEDSNLASQAGPLIALGLSHQHVDVQRRALALLDHIREHLDDESRRNAREAAQYLAPSLAVKAGHWLFPEKDIEDRSDDSTRMGDTKCSNFDTEQALERLSPSVRKMLQLEGAEASAELSAIPEGTLLPLEPEGPPVMPLDTGESFVLEVLAHLEEPHQLIRSERTLDALIRFVPQDLGSDQLATLAAAATRTLNRNPPETYGSGASARSEFAEILYGWVHHSEVDFPNVHGHVLPIHTYLDLRRLEVVQRFADRGVGLASLPTAQDGSIDSAHVNRLADAGRYGKTDCGFLWARACSNHGPAPGWVNTSEGLVLRSRESGEYRWEWLFDDGQKDQRLPIPSGLLVLPSKSKKHGFWPDMSIALDDPLPIREVASLGFRAPECVAQLFARILSHNLDFSSAYWQNRCLLEPLLRQDVALARNGQVLMALGLACKERHERSIAIDACISAIHDGRLSPVALGSAIRWLMPSLLGRPMRWADSFKDVAEVSILHSRFVQVTLVEALGGELPTKIHGLAALLERLHEVSVLTGLPVALPATRAYLDTIKGSSKAAKLARTLLGTGDVIRAHETQTAARAVALERRLAMAERIRTLD
ncbi:MAG: hypothetical protein GY930_23055 [bacterium]|nr:hypothetical protein [bacterium]